MNAPRYLTRFCIHTRFTRCALFFFLLIFSVVASASVGGGGSYIGTKKDTGHFALAASGKTAPLFINADDYPGVMRVLKLLQADLKAVTGTEPALFVDELPQAKEIVIVGTLGRSQIVDRLIREKNLDVRAIRGKREAFLISTVENPLPGVERALLIAGSDKRGTIYGMLDLSTRIGVSPWYWWADVPVEKKKNIYVAPGAHTLGEPAVKYRGIFINDEAPALAGWAEEKFGGFNAQFYEKVFELILRMKGNYLWPAMWGRAFYDDDPKNPQLADAYGIVIGTSHHEPMMRAHDEWRRYGSGRWDYNANAEKLREFWRDGIKRMDDYESIVTVGMRGDGDEPMSEGTAISLLEKIVKDQRDMLAEVTGEPLTSIPQKWALYKEVQDYYDDGMRVPDDVTLLMCDDNWGNVRRLPKPGDPPRAGGYGMYYHFDFVGGPRSYRWLNTNPLPRIWEQMHLSYQYGIREIWIVNVGDIKPMELPTQFFLDYAWNPEQWPAERLPEYVELWAKQQFGSRYAVEIADILARYTKYNGRRKPELLDTDTCSLTDYKEAETVVADYNEIAVKAEKIYKSLPSGFKDAFYQLVLFPVQACANLNEMYVTAGKNRLYAEQGRAATGAMAQKVEKLFSRDAELTETFHTELAEGKWNHMMSQTHIGYTSWDHPPKNIMPDVRKIELEDGAEMGVSIEGSTDWWPKQTARPVLPEFDRFNKQQRYIEVFNRGSKPFDYQVVSGQPWLLASATEGKVKTEQRIGISVDWQKAPTGKHEVPLKVRGANGAEVTVIAVVNNPEFPTEDNVKGFVESNGYVSIEAGHYHNAVEKSGIGWLLIPDFGRTLSGVTPLPVTAATQTPGGDSPHLAYKMYLFSSGKVKVKAYFAPTQNFHNSKEGLRYGISFNNDKPKAVNVHEYDTVPDWKYPPEWNQAVSDNIKITSSEHNIEKPGEHVLKFWMVDPGLVLQKIVVETGEVKPGYLGPPESFYR
jgi:hypothetical protein